MELRQYGVRLASRLLGTVSARLGLCPSSLGLDSRGLCLSCRLLGLSAQQPRTDFCSRLFPLARVCSSRLVLPSLDRDSNQQPIRSFVGAAALWHLLFRQLLRAAV